MQLGNLVMAKYYNSLVNDPKKKLKQRLAIYLSQENFDLIASLDKVIDTDSLKQDEFKYLLAYSKMKVGKLEDSDALLNQIKAPSYLSTKIIEIKKQISECKTNKAANIL